MIRVAVLGANGQVGTELCLILAQQAGIEVIPICRNRMGSAFLRSRGFRCRHGQPADRQQSHMLYGDCNVVANMALVDTVKNPAWAKKVNEALINNVADTLGPRGKHIYFSTMSVYGDPEVGQLFPIRNSYGEDKLVCEGLATNAGSRAACETFIFRLGHVCGDLQGITKQIRHLLQSGQPVQLPDPERGSNTVYVTTIVDAILQVAGARVLPGCYDLMNVPDWSWREVFEFESLRVGIRVEFERIPDKHTKLAPRALAHNLIGPVMIWVANSIFMRRVMGRVLPKLPIDLYRRLKAIYAIKSAGADIERLNERRHPLDAVFRKPVGKRYVGALSPTRQLFGRPEYRLLDLSHGSVWASDLPPAK